MNRSIPKEVNGKQTGWNLRILILSWEYPPNVVGGLSRHVNGLAVELVSMGHEVHVITAGVNEHPSYERLNEVHVHRVTPLNNYDDNFLNWIAGLNLAIALKVEKMADSLKFDIIHAHDWLVGTSAIVIKETLSIPLLSTIHATEHGRNNGIYTEMQQFIHAKELQLIKESDQLIVCSEYMREELLTIYQAPSKKIAVIPNGVEQMEIDMDVEEYFPFLRNRKYIFSVGRMVKEKGYETIIEAAELAKETGQNIYFVVAGKGPMLENYRRQVREKELENFLSFIGYVSDEQRNGLLTRSELAIFPSLYEPFGIVALEAMILGKPTVVSEVGGLKGIVQHLQTGLLMVPGNAISVMENINILLRSPQNAQEIGNRGMKIVKSLYGWKNIASQTTRVFEDTLLNKRVLDSEIST
jgi:glycogen synthase